MADTTATTTTTATTASGLNADSISVLLGQLNSMDTSLSSLLSGMTTTPTMQEMMTIQKQAGLISMLAELSSNLLKNYLDTVKSLARNVG